MNGIDYKQFLLACKHIQYKHDDREEYGNRCCMGRYVKVCIVITQYRNNKVEVFYAESFDKPQMNKIINHILQQKQKHQITKLYVDGANPEVIREIKSRIDEYENYHYYTEEQTLANAYR